MSSLHWTLFALVPACGLHRMRTFDIDMFQSFDADVARYIQKSTSAIANATVEIPTMKPPEANMISCTCPTPDLASGALPATREGCITAALTLPARDRHRGRIPAAVKGGALRLQDSPNGGVSKLAIRWRSAPRSVLTEEQLSELVFPGAEGALASQNALERGLVEIFEGGEHWQALPATLLILAFRQ
jgi:hypothetical protein